MVSIETVHEAFEEQKLFCPTSIARYCRSTVGMEVFWPFKDVSLNVELVVIVFDKGNLTMHAMNNLANKRVSCKDESLFDGLQPENIVDFENMGNTI